MQIMLLGDSNSISSVEWTAANQWPLEGADDLEVMADEDVVRPVDADIVNLIFTTTICKFKLCASIGLKNIHRASGQESHCCERDERLHHHQTLGPPRENRRVRWRECGAGVEREK
jgi:hypothetical protein